MATTDILQVSTEDIITELNGMGELGLPRIADGSFTDEKVLNYGKRAEAKVLSGMPEMYRALTREVRGEQVVEVAYSGQDVFQLGLYPVVEGSLELYVDFGQGGGDGYALSTNLPVVNTMGYPGNVGGYGANANTPYGFRTWADRLSPEKYTVDLATGEVALVEPYKLSAGQKIYADYRHTGMSRAGNLQDMVIRLAASRLGRTIAGISDTMWQQLQQIEDSVMIELQQLQSGEAGIDLLDNIKLVDETRAGAKSGYKRPQGLFM